MKKNNSSSLFKKSFYDFFQITTIYTVILSVFLFAVLYLFYTSSKIDLQYNIKTEISKNITSTIDHYENISSILIASTDVKKLADIKDTITSDVDRYKLTSPYASQLKFLSLNNPYIESCFIFFPKNNSILTSYGFDSTHNNSKYIWYYDELSETCENSYVWSKKTGAYITIYKALDFDNLSAGTIIVTLNFTDLLNSYRTLLETSGGSFALIDTTNNDVLISSQNFTQKCITEFLVNGDSNSIFKKMNISSFDFDTYNWQLIFAYDNFLSLKQSAWTTLLILSVAFIILMLISLFMSYIKAKRLYEPIDSLVKFLQTNSGNDYIDLTSDYSEIKYIIENLQSGLDAKTQFTDISREFNRLKQYSLQLQIQPHFIYNTLEMIYLESYEQLGDNNTVSEMIYNLSRILGYSFRDPNKLVNISNEINVSRSYLVIQGLRFENSFDVIWNINADTENLLTPKLILQPILENAISHGIVPAKRKCTINFSMFSTDDSIVFSIKDNGIGIDEHKLQEINTMLDDSHHVNGKHLGIMNVNIRIRLLFGHAYGCTVFSEKDNGTEVKITIPKITDKNIDIEE